MTDKNDRRPLPQSALPLGEEGRQEELDRLRIQEEGFRLLLRATPDLICLKDGEGRYFEANPAFCSLTGLSRADVIGKTDQELDQILLERGLAPLAGCASPPDEEVGEGRRYRRFIRTVVDLAGESHVLDVIRVPLFNGDGSLRRLFTLGRDVTEREAVLSDLRESKRRLEEVLRVARMGYWARYPDEERYEWDEGVSNIVGGSPEELAPDDEAFLSRIHKEDLPRYLEARRRLAETGRFSCYHRFLRPDGQWVHLRSQGESAPDGARVEGYIQDITSSRAKERELLLASSIFENTVEGICVTDSRNCIISVNPAFSAITGYSLDEALGQNPNILKSSRHDSSFYEEFWRQLLSQGRWQGEIWNRRKSGEIYPEWLSVFVLRDEDGLPLNHIAVFRDLSQHSFRESGIFLPTYHDPLTSLPNKALFTDRLDQELIRARERGESFGVIYIDLDRFKNLNDSLGHILGDQFLLRVAERLLEESSSTEMVARFGGDEFGILVRSALSPSDLSRRAEDFLRLFRRPFDLEGRSVFIGASFGVSLFPDDGTDADALLSRADLAMYRAKEMGGNQVSFFTEELSRRTSWQMELETGLHQALARGEFALHYQPFMDLAERRVVALEALIRWNHPAKGLIGPAGFIDLAEETGLILPLGDWIFRAVCRQIRRWRDAGLPPLPVSVNLSPRQFNRKNLLDRLSAVLAEEGLEAPDVWLEITEGTSSGDDRSLALLEELRHRGFNLFIDDFGTGYSSLSYLRHLPAKGLKIDRSFISGMTGDETMRAIVRAIIELARVLGLEVVAEGVERDEELHLLQEMGCPVIQGYWLTRPLPPDELGPFLEPGRRF